MKLLKKQETEALLTLGDTSTVPLLDKKAINLRQSLNSVRIADRMKRHESRAKGLSFVQTSTNACSMTSRNPNHGVTIVSKNSVALTNSGGRSSRRVFMNSASSLPHNKTHATLVPHHGKMIPARSREGEKSSKPHPTKIKIGQILDIHQDDDTLEGLPFEIKINQDC